MNAVADVRPFQVSEFRTAPLRALGRFLVLVLRYLLALFFLGSTINKLVNGWLWSDASAKTFEARLAEIDPNSFSGLFLSKFAIPYHLPVSWVFVITTITVTVTMTLGLATRLGGVLAFWLMVMIAIGGYYDASLIPLWLIAALFIVFPTGRWFGLDRRMHASHPDSPWFR